MDASPVMEINPAIRTLRLKGALSGSLATGTDKVRSGYGNGDCLYFDFRHRVFAVADGTERFPWASRDILGRLSDALQQAGVPGTAADWRALINGRVYARQKYQHKTTFSCVAVSGGGDDITLTVAHGGDSVALLLDAVGGNVVYQTGRNMDFAGRSPEIMDVVEYRIRDRNLRVVLYSDGFDDLLHFCSRRSLLISSLADAFAFLPVDRIGERIHRVLGENAGLLEHDDIAFMALDPFRLAGIGNTRVLIGGTQPHEEKRFRSGREEGKADCWIPNKAWTDAADTFRNSGITVQWD